MRPLRRLACACLLLVAVTAAGAEGGEPARISLVTQVQMDGSTRLVAAVSDGAGAPVAGAAVTFLARTAFGWLRLAEEDTGAAGTASFTLGAPVGYTEVQAQAGDTAALRAGLLLAQAEEREPVRRPGLDALRGLSPQPGFLSPYPPVQILFVAVLLGGIWTTYAYLVSLLVRMKRAR